MKRLALLSWFALLASAALAYGQGIQLEIQGENVKNILVDKVVIVKSSLTVVGSFPFSVQAPAGSALYFWSFPPGVVATDMGDRLEVTNAPKGNLTISVKAMVIDWDAKKVIAKFGQISFAVGEVPPGPAPIPPTPPVPPPIPEDAFSKAVRTAWDATAEADKGESRQKLASLYRKLVATPPPEKTLGEFYSTAAKAGDTLIARKILPVRQEIARELARLFPEPPATPMDDAMVARLITAFLRVAQVLEALP
jgi:hypothetical protein